MIIMILAVVALCVVTSITAFPSVNPTPGREGDIRNGTCSEFTDVCSCLAAPLECEYIREDGACVSTENGKTFSNN